MLDKGIIISIQGYSKHTTEELAMEAISGGAIAIRCDKEISCNIPIIGLHKIKVDKLIENAYITPDIENIEKVKDWSDYIAIDYRRLNKNLDNINEYIIENKLKVIADISSIKDYRNILEKKYQYSYIATSLSVFKNGFFPDIQILAQILKINNEENIIAEGNFNERNEIRIVFNMGINNVCIGSAVSNIYKLTKKYVSIL